MMARISYAPAEEYRKHSRSNHCGVSGPWSLSAPTFLSALRIEFSLNMLEA